MPRPPAPHFPPPPDSPDVQRALARLRTDLHLSPGTAEVAYGFYRGLTKKEIAAWTGTKFDAIHERTKRLFRSLGVRTQGAVAGLVGASLALV